IFALGSILYFALSGETPFARSSPIAIASAVASSPAKPLAGVAPALAAAVKRAMMKDKAARHPSALAFADELRAWRTRSRRPSPLLAPLAIAVLSIVAGVGLALAGPAHHAESAP